ncbi:MAG TPA: M20/M25/M40 family metallo-hydrolase [Kofleriaceae bacterium]
MRKLVGAVLLVAVAGLVQAEPANNDIDRIIDQGLRHSKVMQTAEYMDDWIGGRLTNSPAMRTAEAWTMKQYTAWGLKNVRKDGWEFGRGWSIVSSSVKMTSPRPLTLTAQPVAWTPGTNGVVSAEIVVAPVKKERDFAPYHGKLKGKIVLVSLPDDGSEPAEAPFKRLTSEDIGKLDKYENPEIDPDRIDRWTKRLRFATQLDKWLKDEGALVAVKMSYRDGKLVHGEGYRFIKGDTAQVPWIEVAAEDYRRLTRLAKTGANPKLEIDIQVKWDDSDSKAYNIIAEIPGTSGGTEYVMAGAHLDSWIAGDGAADNGAGSNVVMEAARILAQSGVRPKRTIRFVLWAGEEQGLLGSMAYIEKYLASRGLPDKPGMEAFIRWSTKFPVKQLPGYKDLVAYFNIDNGSGRLHGIHAEGNVDAVPLLREWLQPFAGMGAGTVVSSPTGGTDHVFMQAVGIPAFQFIQDPLDYMSRVHHSSIDTFDHLKADDMRQASVVLAGVLYEAANSAKTLPHMPLPTQPVPTSPFKYDDPADD